MAPDAQVHQWAPLEFYVPAGFVRAVPGDGWGRRPEPPPPPLRIYWQDYFGCFLIVLTVYMTAVQFRGILLDDEYSVVNVLALLLARTHMLVMKPSSPAAASSSWTAVALLPTCPAPALNTPPVCYDWEKPAAAAVVLPRSSSGSADSNWRIHEHDGDYKAAKKCFDSLVRDAGWTCDEQEDDYKAAMKCFDSLVRDAARICFVWSYNSVPPTSQSDDLPPS